MSLLDLIGKKYGFPDNGRYIILCNDYFIENKDIRLCIVREKDKYYLVIDAVDETEIYELVPKQ